MARAPSPISELRAVAYALLMLAASIFLTIVEFISYPVVKFVDPTLFTFHRMTMFLSRNIIKLFVKVEVQGMEHVPPKTPMVIVCNHQSDVDNNILSCALLGVNFKVIFKHELLYYPGIGSAFYMVGHVPVRRGDKESGKKSLQACADWLKRGCNIFFFPEGTRKITGETGPIGPLKPGAFRLACETGVPIMPVTLSGGRDVMPMTGFKLGFGTVKVTVHAPVSTVNKSVESLMDEVRSIMLADMRDVDEVKYTPPSGAAVRNVSSHAQTEVKKER